MKRIFTPGNSSRSSTVAASASCVGMSPAEAMTRSGFAALVVTRPVPNPDAFRAVLNSGIHIQVLKMQLFVGNDHVDVVLAPEALIGYRQQTINIGRKVNASDGSAFIKNNVRKPGPPDNTQATLD